MRMNFICEWNLSALWLLPAIFANYLNYLVRVVRAHHFWALATFAVCFSVLGSLGSVFIPYVECISGKFICVNVFTSLCLLLLAVHGYTHNFYCKSLFFPLMWHIPWKLIGHRLPSHWEKVQEVLPQVFMWWQK
jgi:hypothetical protein